MPYASIGRVRLFYTVCGHGEPLVLIPGLGSDHGGWFRQTPALRKHCRVIAYDPRSIGKSSHPKEPYDFKALADDVVGLMDHLTVQKAHVLGQSYGGMVAQEVAISHPDRVLKLILASSTTDGQEANITPPALLAALGLKEGDTEVDLSRIDAREVMRVLIPLSFNKRLYRVAMSLITRFFLKPDVFEGLTDQIRAFSGHATVDRLPLIKAPALVITGADDHVVSPSASEVLASRIPNARLVMVKGGSHGFNIEMAQRFNREVLDFLRAGR